VRKILSIVIALGLILGLSVMAVPTAGATCTAEVSLDPLTACAGAETTYTINFTAPLTLQPGDVLSVTFGDGTVLTGVAAGDITMLIPAVGSPLSVDISGTTLKFPIPGLTTIYAGTEVKFTVEDVKNPVVAGDYSLDLDYETACCSEVFDCAEYTINPLRSTYGFVWDSSPTYPGIALDFVPPFKACGQNETDGALGGFNIGLIGSLTVKYLNAFDLLLKPTLVGCAGPCASNVTVTLNLTAAPEGSTVTLSLNESTTYIPAAIHTLTPTATVPQPEIVIGEWALGANVTVNWSNAIHFDTVGSYQICVEAICPWDGTPTCPDCLTEEDTVFASACYDIEVYQWKEACKIDFYRKWNLISLPLVPLEPGMSIEDLLLAHPKPSEFVSIHYYDRCADAWSVWGNGQTSLSTLEDGKGYWVKVDYTLGSATKYPGAPIEGLWVWGTTKPVPPAGPSAYAVCDGWNMIGFTEGCFPGTIWDDEYLWNFWPNGAPTPPSLYGAVYGWNAVTQTWDTDFEPYDVEMTPGKGYWVPFDGDGTILPP
jgi:hypothetical protein